MMETPTQPISTNIPTEINQLRKISQGDSGKACLFNLVVYTHEPRRTHYFEEVITMIQEQFPCRVIFIQGNLSSSGFFRFQVIKEKKQNECQLSCEQIYIEVGGPELHRISFLLLPLFVPDLPIYLLWGQDPTTENTILPHLQTFATRLIVDSEATEDLQKFSQSMLHQLQSSSIQLMDMNWARIEGLREVLAQIFDSSERLEQLSTAPLIHIIYNDLPNEFFMHSETQAIYLQAWLASRLNWRFHHLEKENHKFIIHYQNADLPHEVHLIPQLDQRFDPESLLKMAIWGTNDYECHIERISTHQVKVHASNQFQCELPFTLLIPTLQSGRGFIQEIFYHKISDQYAPMLQNICLTKWS